MKVVRFLLNVIVGLIWAVIAWGILGLNAFLCAYLVADMNWFPHVGYFLVTMSFLVLSWQVGSVLFEVIKRAKEES